MFSKVCGEALSIFNNALYYLQYRAMGFVATDVRMLVIWSNKRMKQLTMINIYNQIYKIERQVAGLGDLTN